MRVRRIALEGVGRHRGVVIDRLGDGLTVVCGRNETGKSTLLAGLRGVLFGRVRASDIEVLVVPGASGRLWVEEGGVLCQVERPLARTHPPTVTLPDGRTVTGHAVLRELFPSLAPVEELLYTSVFTFQLAELTDLVDAGRVAHALYAVGLFGGKAPAEVEKDLRERAKAVYNRRSRSSALVRCLREADEVEQRLRRLDDTAEAYASLLERLERARERLRGLEEQCSEAASRLEQARKDAAAAPHHRRLRSLQAELAAYADVADWQADAQQDVLECRARLAELAAVLDAARREWTTRRQAADALQVDEAAAAALPKLQSLSDQLPEVRRRCADWRACEQAAAAAWKQAEKARNRLSGAWSEAAVQDACLSESVLAKAAAAVREAEQLDAALTEAERAWRSQQARVQAAAAAWQQRWTAVCRQAAVFCEASQEAAAALGPGAWTDAQADGERGGSAQALAAAREQCARLQAFAADWLDRAQDELHRLEEEEHDIRRQLEALTADHEAANSRRSRRGSGLPSGGRPRWAWWAALVACAVLAAWQGWRGAAAGAGWALAVTLLLAVGLWLDARERRRERQRAHAKAALADQRASCERRMAACRDERERLTHERRAAEALLRELGAAEPLLQSWLAASQAAAEAAGQVDGLGASRAAMGDRWQAFLRHEVWAGAGSARPAADAGVALGPQAEAVQRFVQLSPASFVAEAKVVLEVREAEREAREQRHQAATHREWLARWVRAAEAAVAESAPAIPLSVTGRADSGEDLESRLAVVSEWLQRALAHARQQADRQRQRAAMDDELDLLARTIARQEEAVRRLRERLAGLYEALGARDGDAFDQLAARAAQRRRLLEACREQEARLHGQYGGRDLYESRQAVLDQADEAVLAQQVAHWEAECARLSREVTERTREVWALEQELSAWETRAGGLELRWQLARCRSERDRLAKRWAALVWAEALTRQARLTFERTRQPEALQVAAALFRHLTGNRYVALAVRTGSAGDAELVCVQADGREWSPARLSRGTREQLYLALRLALIHLYRRRGVDLPVVMDDPMVNFDGPRLAAALQVIAQEAEGGQVLYLTCRPELADLASQIDGVHVMYWPDAEA